MKRDDDFASRRRKRKEEDTQESVPLAGKKLPPHSSPLHSEADQFEALLKKIQSLIEQVNSLYNQYFSGVEKRPPVERRKMLDESIDLLQNMPKPTPGHRFRFSAVQSSYRSYVEKWERRLLEMERI